MKHNKADDWTIERIEQSMSDLRMVMKWDAGAGPGTRKMRSDYYSLLRLCRRMLVRCPRISAGFGEKRKAHPRRISE